MVGGVRLFSTRQSVAWALNQGKFCVERVLKFNFEDRYNFNRKKQHEVSSG